MLSGVFFVEEPDEMANENFPYCRTRVHGVEPTNLF